MNRRTAWVVGIVVGGLILCFFGVLAFFYAAVQGAGSSHHGSTGGGNIGVIEIKGEIKDSRRTLKDIHEFEDDNGIKAVLLRVDSPGGAVGPSQEIHDAVERLREKKKVVVSMGSLAASGGYYIAVAGDKVYANAGTLTGSIGVIMQTFNVSGVLKWAGVETNTLTAGKMKDVGSPFRAMTADERTYMLALLADVHAQFIEAVAKGRHLKLEEVKPIADGRVFSGRQAKALKLVDELGGFDAAVADAGKMAGIKGEPTLVYPHHPRQFLRNLFGDDEEAESLFQGMTRGVLRALDTNDSLRYELPAGITP